MGFGWTAALAEHGSALLATARVPWVGGNGWVRRGCRGRMNDGGVRRGYRVGWTTAGSARLYRSALSSDPACYSGGIVSMSSATISMAITSASSRPSAAG